MIRYNTDCPYCHDIFDQYCNLFKDYKNCNKYDCEVLKILKENEQLKQENKRAKILLKATLDLLQKQKESHYVLNLLENTVFYDNAECDGYCLFDDIENFLNCES